MMHSHSSLSGKLMSHTRGSLSGGRWRCLCLHTLLRCSLWSLCIPLAPDANHCIGTTCWSFWVYNILNSTFSQSWQGLAFSLSRSFFFSDRDQVLVTRTLYSFICFVWVPAINAAISCRKKYCFSRMISHASPCTYLFSGTIMLTSISSRWVSSTTVFSGFNSSSSVFRSSCDPSQTSSSLHLWWKTPTWLCMVSLLGPLYLLLQ